MIRLCAVSALVVSIAAADAPGAGREIPLVREGGVYQVSVVIDGWLVRPFIVDSGAVDVQVSADVFQSLYPRGAPPPRFLPGGSYRLADGRVVTSRRFLIRSLRIGDHQFPDVPASIGEPRAPLLLGQNVLARLGAWSIDNRRGVLVLGERGAAGSDTGCLSWRTAPSACAVAAARDHFRDAQPRHDVTSLVLLESDGDHARVLADVIRFDAGRPPVRLCGALELRRAGAGWRLRGEAELRGIGSEARCVP